MGLAIPKGWVLETAAPPAPVAAAPQVVDAPEEGDAVEEPVGEMSTPAIPPVPAGFELVDNAQAPAAPAAPDGPGIATDQPSLKKGLEQLYAAKAEPSVIRDYIRQSGFQLDDSGEKWLDNEYTQHLGLTGTVTDDSPLGLEVTPPAEDIGIGGSAWSGVRSGALAGFDDELAAGVGALGNKIGSIVGANDSTASMGDIYHTILDQERQHKDQAYKQNAMAYGAGFIPGMVISTAIPGLGGAAAPAESVAGRVSQASLMGARVGAASGAGNAEGGVVDRLVGAGEGAAMGLAAGPLTYPLAVGGSRLIDMAASRLPKFRGNAMDSGLDALTRAAPQDAAEMQIRADQMRRAGVEPRPVDVVDESGRGAMRSAAAKSTPARDEVAQHANAVYSDMPDRVSQQAQRISTSRPTSRQIASAIKEERTNMDTPALRAAAPDPVPVTDEIKQVLMTGEGQAAMRGAIKFIPDVGERQQAQALLRAATKGAKSGPVDPDAAFAKVVPGWDRMPEPARAQIRAQMPHLVSEDPWAGVSLNVDFADKLARVLKANRATPGLENVGRTFGNLIRDTARQASPAYATALDEYAARSGVMNAANGERQFVGTDFLKSLPDQYNEAVGAASSTPAAALDGGGAPTLSEADALRVAARDAVVDRATAGSGNQAASTARQIARGPAQQARNARLLGGRGAQELEEGMGAEVSRLDNTRYIDARVGSKTAGMNEDDIMSDLMSMGANVASAGKWGTIKAVAAWLKGNGIRAIDAERLARDAINPDRTDYAINYLAQRGLQRDRATALVRAIAGTMAGHAGGTAASSEEAPTPPNSVRAIMRGR